MLAWLQRFLGPRYKEPKGILLYDTVQEVILVHKMLAMQRFAVRLVAPPPEFRVGCDLAIEFEQLEQEALETALARSGSRPVRVVSTKQMLPGILSEVAFVEIDGFLMSKAGNMKITVDKKDRRIVNISGGGCPDIPYVAMRLQGRRLEEAPNPVDLGNSLCSFMLQISFDALRARLGAR